MRILYAIQGTGNGHISRARDIVPELQKYGTVDLLLSGYQVDLDFPYPIKFRLKGLSFIFGKKGAVSLWQTARRLRPFSFFSDVFSLPVHEYDIVVNDFEPVSAWACKWRRIPCIALSHQSAVLSNNAPKPHVGGIIGKLLLKYYAPYSDYYGFHFERYDPKVFLPVIRKEVQQLLPVRGDHYTVYLPAYDDKALIRILSRIKNVQWQVFSKHNKESYCSGNISITPVENRSFLESLASCRGALLGAGFEGPAEALFLGKKLLVVPMKAQYEQQCNAAALEKLGVPVIDKFNESAVAVIDRWTAVSSPLNISFPGEVAALAVARLIDDWQRASFARYSAL